MAYSTAMRFVETPVFTRELRRWLDDEHCRALQTALLLRPEQGAVIRGSGGLRKLRWAGPDTGKRGDLTPSQVKVLGRLVREEFR